MEIHEMIKPIVIAIAVTACLLGILVAADRQGDRTERMWTVCVQEGGEWVQGKGCLR